MHNTCVLVQIRRKNFRRTMLKISERFKDHYEQTNVRLRVEDLVALASGQFPRKSIFETVREQKDVYCDIRKISKMYGHILNLFQKASQLEIVYKTVKVGKTANKKTFW